MKRLFWQISHFFEKLFSREHAEVVRTAAKGEPWDEGYLLELERAKIKEMVAYHEKVQGFENWEYVVRDMKLCITLLDIILGNRNLFQFDECKDGENCLESLSFRYHCLVKVNLKNIKRFVAQKSLYHMYKKMPHELYELKAKHLYYKIREEHTDEWWH